MNDYIIMIDSEYVSVYGNIFMVKANNKKEAKDKVYEYCKDVHDYKKKEIIVYTLKELYNAENVSDGVVEIN